jgi:hypothetical protein
MELTSQHKYSMDQLQTTKIAFLRSNLISDNTNNNNTRHLKQQQHCCIFLYLWSHRGNDSKKNLHMQLLSLSYNIGIQPIIKFCHLLFLISLIKWQTWSVSRLPQCYVWKSVTHKRLYHTRCLSTPWKDKGTYYNIFESFINRLDL